MKADEIRAEWKRVEEAAETVDIPPNNIELMEEGPELREPELREEGELPED